MQLEKLMLVLRFREGREAVDLGLIMAQHWYKVLCQTLLVVIAPFILITHVLFWDKLIPFLISFIRPLHKEHWGLLTEAHHTAPELAQQLGVLLVRKRY